MCFGVFLWLVSFLGFVDVLFVGYAVVVAAASAASAAAAAAVVVQVVVAAAAAAAVVGIVVSLTAECWPGGEQLCRLCMLAVALRERRTFKVLTNESPSGSCVRHRKRHSEIEIEV